MKYEIFERKTGTKMSRTKLGEIMGSTLFDSITEALAWMEQNGLSQQTHEVRGHD